KLDQFLAQDEEFKNQLVRKMLEAIMPAHLFKQYHKTYGLFSILVHGNELITLDVFRDFISGSQEPRVDYQTKRYKPDDTALSLTHILLDILQMIEEPFSGVPIYADLRMQFKPIRKRVADQLSKGGKEQPLIADVFPEPTEESG
ncbi:MAG: hypothetical protein M3Z37_11795, partial [Candidatus Eremiobacteraeota bacterium]|nr:hypothetical protein [Candidatus Eremiobacteraeota bacterium]